MRLRQHAVHSNGTKTISYTGCINTETCTDTTQCQNTGYSNHSNEGYGDKYDTGCSNHSNSHSRSYGCTWGNWCAVCNASTNLYSAANGCAWCPDGGCTNSCSNSGYSNHSNGGCANHSNTGANNHSNTSVYVNTYTYSDNAANTIVQSNLINSNIPSYVLDTSLSDKGVNLTNQTIILYLDNIYAGMSNYRLYMRNADLGATNFKDWQLIAEQGQDPTFSVDISAWPQGQVQFAVTAYNGSSWSAILANNNWTYDHHQALTPSTNTTYQTVSATGGHTTNTFKTSTQTVITVSDTTQYEVTGGSYALSEILQIIRYTPPTWLRDPYAKATTQQLQRELNKALNVYTGTGYVFSSTPIVCNWTMITLGTLKEMQDQTNHLLTAAGKSMVDFTTKEYMSGIGKINPDQALKDLQDLMDSLGE